MKKLFLIIPVLMFAVMAKSATTEVAPGTNNLKTAITAASANDVLVLTTGIYNEDGDFSINKNITIQAADGEHPVIAQHYYIKVEDGADVTFEGIKFDGSLYPSTGASDHCVRSKDSSTGEEDVTFINCEFTGYPSHVIYVEKYARRWNSITIRDCYFHNNAKSSVYVYKGSDDAYQSCNAITIQNSTFVNGEENVIYFKAPDADETTATVSVVHCTFYNHSKRAINIEKSANFSINVSNCIFTQPAKNNYKSVECSGGTITHCLSFNTGGYSDGTTQSDNLTGNPYFVNLDPSNYDFSVASFSPAHNAGTDSKNLGDNYHWKSNDAAHPTTQTLSAAENVILTAVASAWPGDVIILGDGEFVQGNNYTVFDKKLLVKAADNATPIIKFTVPAQMQGGARVEFRGVKFDMTDMYGQTWYEHLIEVKDASDNNRLIFENCKFYNDAKNNSIIYCASDKKLDSLIIENCKFYDATKSCVFLANTGLKGLTISNSTFYNISTNADSYYAGVIDARTTTGKIRIDHCTFYDCFAMNTDYAIIRLESSDGEVSNCIFAMSSSSNSYRTIYGADGGGTKAKNCLVYNYTNDSNVGMRSAVAKTNCFTGNPLFADASEADFRIPANWSTGNISPAFEAATDGTTLGDKRWFTDEVIPSADITSSYDLMPAKAMLSGNIALDDSKIKYSGSGTPGTAKWKLHIENPRYIYAIVDVTAGNESGHKLTLTVKDADGNTVSSMAASETSYEDDDITLPGYVYISEEGDYTFILSNSTSNSGVSLDKITLAYFGGDVTEISTSSNTTLVLTDALYQGCTRTVDSIGFPSSGTASAWMKWKISTTAGSFYDVTVNFGSSNAHNLTLAFYEDESASPIATVAEGGYTSTKGTGLTLVDRIYLSGGKNYIAKITNATDGSHAKVSNVVFAPVATPVTALPTTSTPVTLDPDDAIKSALAYASDNQLYFAPSGKYGYIQDQWAMWKVSAADAGTYLFTMNVTATNMQDYRITIIDSEDNEIAISDWSKSSGAKTLTHYFYLPAGTYFVKVQNTKQHSDGHMVSLVVSLPDDLVVLDDDADAETTNALIADKKDVAGQNIQTLRTIKGGMYNAICLPFSVSSSMAKEVFGADVELYTLGSATIEDGYILNLELDNASDIYQGTPVVIRTSRDIINPVFAGVEIIVTTPDKTTKGNAKYVGTFVKTTLTANPDLLFIGADNTLYFPTADVTLKGMRAWFEIHDLPAGVAIRRARIVNGKGEATDIELVNTQEPTAKSQKLIINGQLIIIRDGIRYNVMGVKVK